MFEGGVEGGAVAGADDEVWEGEFFVGDDEEEDIGECVSYESEE